MRPGPWCFLLVWVLGGTTPQHPAPQRVSVRGKVTTLAKALEARHIELKADPEPTEKQVVIVGADGAITPLFSDQGSRCSSSTGGCLIDRR